MSSPVPHSTEYRTRLERARHGGFQTLVVEHRTPDAFWTIWHYDGDRRRRAKTEADEDEDRLTLGTCEEAAP